VTLEKLLMQGKVQHADTLINKKKRKVPPKGALRF
jgi:hypothetical protein